MNRQTDQERLLTDVLAEADAAGFRETLFSETLRLARRRRRFRHTRRAASVVAMFAGVAWLVWRSLPPPLAPAEAMQKNYAVVHTQPQPAAAVVLTRPLGADRRVTSLAIVTEVRTTPGGGLFREIDDDELLALAEPKPAALVRLGPHTAELVLLSSTD